MKKYSLSFRTLLCALSLCSVTLGAWADKQAYNRLPKDSLTVSARTWDEMSQGRMAQSAYPVKLAVKGRSLKVTTKYEQVLPIYTQSGTLYLAMQLSPGVNWLNGLPRGRYRINNRTISIK